MEPLHRNHSGSYLCLAIKLEMYDRHRKSQICRDLSKPFVDIQCVQFGAASSCLHFSNVQELPSKPDFCDLLL